MSTSKMNTGPAAAIISAIPGDTPRRVRRDLRFVRWYAYTIGHVIKRYENGAEVGRDTGRPTELLSRVEVEVASECRRMRLMFWAILAVLLMPLFLAVFLWSGLYWLPVSIPWFPFDRGMYGLPLLSLFEWLAFLMLAAFFAGSLAVILDGIASTRRVSADFRLLGEASAEEKVAIAAEARCGAYPRSAYLLSRAKPFADYAELMSPEVTHRVKDDEASA